MTTLINEDPADPGVHEPGELRSAAQRVIAAFEALGRSRIPINDALHRLECEASMTALKAALTAPAPQAGKPIAWAKRFGAEGHLDMIESNRFLAEDAAALGWRPLVYGDIQAPSVGHRHAD